jgi:potassium-transporting ATPase KdpC subunit
MLSAIKPAILMTVILTVITGLLYPFAMTGVVQVLFPHQANGSLMTPHGQPVGSSLIGQNFSKPEYFHPRLSAAGEKGYDGMASQGSNLAMTNPALDKRLAESAAAFRKENPDFSGPIPADAITASGSGLDPDISPANALAQCERVAKARNLPVEKVRSLVRDHIEGRQLGFLGEPRINVLLLNLALDKESAVGK